jgi:hypothetical protein
MATIASSMTDILADIDARNRRDLYVVAIADTAAWFVVDGLQVTVGHGARSVCVTFQGARTFVFTSGAGPVWAGEVATTEDAAFTRRFLRV